MGQIMGKDLPRPQPSRSVRAPATPLEGLVEKCWCNINQKPLTVSGSGFGVLFGNNEPRVGCMYYYTNPDTQNTP